MTNGSSNGTAIHAPETEIVERPKRRRFSVEEKRRILHEADACAPRTLGAYLRREGIYSSQLYAWRRERDRGDLDIGFVRRRAAEREAHRADAQRVVELEREIRKLKRRNERLELFEEIRKKAAGLLGLEFKSPEIDED